MKILLIIMDNNNCWKLEMLHKQSHTYYKYACMRQKWMEYMPVKFEVEWGIQ